MSSTQPSPTTREPSSQSERSLFNSAGTTVKSTESTRIIHMDIQGMTCASCVGRVERKLRKIPGVDPAVNLPLESARVIVPEGVSDEQIVETINNAGYTGAPQERVARGRWNGRERFRRRQPAQHPEHEWRLH